MEGFTIIDGAVALVVVVSALLAYARGFVREVLAIGGWAAAAVVAFVFAPQATPLVKEIPGLGTILADSCELSVIAAFAGVFAVALLVVSLFVPVFASAVRRSALGGVDQALGFLFGAARGVLVVALAYFLYQTVAAAQQIEMIDDSRSAQVFASLAAEIDERSDPDAALGWITGQYEQLVGVCDTDA